MFSRLLAALTLALAVTKIAAAPHEHGHDQHHKRQSATAPRAKVVMSCTVPNTAALTFDDAPYWYTYDVSKQLVAAGAKGTFFFNGNNYGCIYGDDNRKRVKYVFDKGHQVASHTWSHKDMATLTWDQIHHEMWLVEEALQRITGVSPAFMRPPFGSYNDLVLQASAIRQQTVAIWDLDAGDGLGLTAEQSKQRYTDAVNTTPKPVSLLALNHDTHVTTVFDVLPHAIKTLQGAGYKLVTLAECLNMPAYTSVAQPQTYNPATWKC